VEYDRTPDVSISDDIELSDDISPDVSISDDISSDIEVPCSPLREEVHTGVYLPVRSVEHPTVHPSAHSAVHPTGCNRPLLPPGYVFFGDNYQNPSQLWIVKADDADIYINHNDYGATYGEPKIGVPCACKKSPTEEGRACVYCVKKAKQIIEANPKLKGALRELLGNRE
jgi:hypothetical protein